MIVHMQLTHDCPDLGIADDGSSSSSQLQLRLNLGPKSKYEIF